MKKSLSDLMLAILDFDFCVETIIKTVLVDSGIRINRGRRGFKTFDELISDLTTSFPNLGYIIEITSLHKLRNDVQHQSNIPSEQEVSRHKMTVRLFFDDVLRKVYGDTISYDEISLALFIQSENEKIILSKMEESYQKGNYRDSVYYGKQVAEYHVRLLRDNLGVPIPQDFRNPFTFTRFGDLEEIGRALEQVVERLNWAVDRLCLREHHDEINELLEGHLADPYFGFYRGAIQRVEANHDDAGHVRNIVYEFLTSTQDLIKKKELESPFIFDLVIKKESNNMNICQVGILSQSEITEAKLTIRKVMTKDEIEKKIQQQEEVFDIPKESGLQKIQINPLEKDRRYEIHLAVTNKDRKREYAHYTYLPVEKKSMS